MLTNRNTLAKTSGKPGKTQLINHFIINKTWFVADLPGYGYAKVSKKNRATFHSFTVDFLQYRPNLLCVFVLLDSRIPAQKIDLEFMEYCGVKGIPFVMCFTKTDKLKTQELDKSIETYKEKMFEQWEEIPRIFISSSINKNGQDDILDFIENLNQGFYDKKD
jgi:GTP-binding protein